MDYIDVAQSFSVVRRRTQALVVEACSDLQLTYSEYVLLLRLYDNEGCSQEVMGRDLFLDKAVITRVIKLLEKKDMIYRVSSDKDRRIKLLYLTEKGRSLESYIKGIVQQLISFLAKDMEPEKVKILMEGFSELAEKMSNASYTDVYGKKEGKSYA